MRSMKRRRIAGTAIIELILIVLCVIWLVPIVWIILQAFRGESGALSETYIPNTLTFANFTKLFTETLFPRWFLNTLFVAVCSCVLSTLLTLMVAYVLSRFRFKARRWLMNIALILGMFPGFMSMVAIYYILKAFGLDGQLAALIVVYAGGSATGFYVAKGFFDTVNKSLDEAARIDGAANWQVFFKIIFPLSKPIIVYTALMAFMGPWCDFIFAKVILGSDSKNFTVAIGLYDWISEQKRSQWFTCFAAGSIVVAVPIVAMFMALQRYYVEGITGGSVKG